jgi:CHRD domain
MRRFAISAPLSAALVMAFGDAGSAQQIRAEKLVGGNENPPVVSDGSGRFSARLNDDSISFRLRYDVASVVVDGEESDVTQAHLHIANPGNNGGVVAFLCSNMMGAPTDRTCPPSPGKVTGDIFADDVLPVTEGMAPDEVVIIGAGDLDGLKRLIEQGSVYANVHTNAHAGGEIRGQLEPRRR